MSEEFSIASLKLGEVYESKKGVVFKVIKKYSDTELWVITKDDCVVLELPKDAVIIKKIEKAGSNWFNGKPDSVIEEKISKERKIVEEKEEVDMTKEKKDPDVKPEVKTEVKTEKVEKPKKEKVEKEPKKVKTTDEEKAKIFNLVKEHLVKSFPEGIKAKDESVAFSIKDTKCKFVKKDLMVITTAKINAIEENKKLDNCGDFKFRYSIVDLYEALGYKA